VRIAIQPCGDSVAQAHYVDTVQKLVHQEDVLPFLSSLERTAFQEACGQIVAVWGVTPGKLGQNKKKWSKLQPGDVALLYGKKRIFSQARITYLVHNRELAIKLWGVTADDQAWEYIYFMDELQEVDISVSRYNTALGYSAANIVQGFQVHEDEQAEALAEVLEIDPVDDAVDAIVPGLSVQDAISRLQALVASDSPIASKVRNEASIFRSFLFGGRLTARCDLCGRELPCGLLVAAHKKPRASCTEAERRDPEVVMRACRLGCDELFERGYLCVDSDGFIKAGIVLTASTNELKVFARELIDRSCAAHSFASEKYFAWHRQHPIRRLK
jgi:hypothetical protein